jgi:ABC-2 type transport system permease protein
MGAAEFLNRGVRDRTRALIGWCAGIGAYVALLGAIFPSLEGSAELDELAQNYPEALRALFGLSDVNITTGPGYFDTELFSFMLPLLAIVLAIGSGSRAIAGEEEAGRLELLLSYPVRRRTAVVMKGIAVGLEMAIFAVAGFAALALANLVFGLEFDLERLAGGMLGVALLGLLHGWLAVAVGAARPNRALAIGLPAAFAALGYLVGGLHDLASWLDPFRFVSSFWWIGQSPLSTGVDLGGFVVVALAAAAALGAGALLLERRDLQVP